MGWEWDVDRVFKFVVVRIGGRCVLFLDILVFLVIDILDIFKFNYV